MVCWRRPSRPSPLTDSSGHPGRWPVTRLAGAAGGVERVLTGLPGHRRAFQTGEVTGDAGGAGFEALEQRAGASDSITAATARALRGPGGHLDGPGQLRPAQSIFHHALVGLTGGEAL